MTSRSNPEIRIEKPIPENSIEPPRKRSKPNYCKFCPNRSKQTAFRCSKLAKFCCKNHLKYVCDDCSK